MIIRVLLSLWFMTAAHSLADDSGTGLPQASRKDGARIIVRFKDDVSLSEAKRSVAKHGGTYLKRISTVHNAHVFTISGKADLAKLLTVLQKNPAVIYAERDQPVSIEAKPPP